MRTTRSPVVVGRDEELAAIGAALSGTPRRGACLFLLGEAGAGKTRLLRETREQARARGLACLLGGAPALGAPPAFGVLAEALRGWTRSHPLPEAELAPFAPGLRQVLPELPAPDAGDLTADQVRLLALEGAFRVLARIGSARGAVLLLDDLQDADQETLAFLHHAAASVRDGPVVVIGAVRIPEGAAVATEARVLEEREQAVVLELEPLGGSGVGELVQAILDAPAPVELVAEIAGRSGGVPLLIEEVLEAQLEAGTLQIRFGEARWSGIGATTASGNVLELARRKLSRVSEPAARTITAAAVVGRTDPNLLALVTGASDRQVIERLREGVEVGLLDPGPTTPTFRHALLREALERTSLEWERTDVHRRAGEAIAALHGDDPSWLEERAHHLEAAGSSEEAAVLLLEAGRRSLEAQTPASAEATLRRALALAEDRSVAEAVRDGLAEATGMQGRWEEALSLDAELLGSEGDTPRRLERMARHAASAGRLDDAEGLLERARAVGGEPGGLDALGALVLLWRGDLEQAASRAGDALHGAPEDARIACSALDVLGRARAAQGRAEEATAAFERWIEVARGAGLTALELQGLMELGIQDFLEGHRDDHLRAARDLADRHGVFASLVLADLGLLWWCGRRARVPEAVGFGEEATDLCRRLSLDLRPHAVMALGWARGLAACGSGEEQAAEALELSPGDVDLEILGAWMRGEWELRSGRYGEAAEALGRAAKVMHASPSAVPPPAPFLWLCALVAAGRHDEARRALPEVRSSPALSRQYVNRFWIAVGEALLEGSSEALDAATGPFEDSATMDVAVARVLGAEVLGGDAAPERLRGALRTFERGGMATDAARVRQLLRSLGEPVPRARRPALDLPEGLRRAGVTSREADVLSLVSQGLSNRAIAEELYLSPRTVQSHISSLLAKLEVENRAGLVVAGLALAGGTAEAPEHAEPVSRDSRMPALPDPGGEAGSPRTSARR